MAVDVSAIVTDRNNQATSLINSGNGFIAALQNVSALTIDVPSITTPDQSYTSAYVASYADIAGNQPVEPSISVILPTAPEAPVTDFTAVTPIVVADFNVTPPSISIPTAPSTALPSVPSDQVYTAPAIPDAPTYTLPTAPTFYSVAIPDAPSISIPAFSSTLPINTLVVPTNVFTYAETAYSDTLLDSVKAKLLADLTNGTYGLESSDEDALWNRARDREAQGVTAQVAQIKRESEAGIASGFALPQGVLIASIEQAFADSQGRLSSVERDIALQRNEKYFQARQFTITTAVGLEQILIGYWNSLWERTLNASRALVELGIAVYNAQAQNYNAQLDAYRTEAQVFAERVRASLAQTEIYRAQIEGAKALLDSQRSQVELYRAQIAGIEQAIGLYKTRMEAANIQAHIEEIKMQAFRSRIEAYAEQVRAKVAEFQMYDAQIRGEVAKVQAYEVQARGYEATVKGAQVKAEVQRLQLQTEIEQARVEVDVFNGRIQEYRAQIDAELKDAEVSIETYRAKIQSYSALIGGLEAVSRVQIQAAGVDQNIAIESLRAAISAAQLSVQSQEASGRIRESAADSGARVIASQLVGILNSVTTLAAATQSS